MTTPDDRSEAWRRVPGSSRLLLHPESGRRGASIRALAGASDWRRQLADRLGVAAVAICGAGRMPTAPPLQWPPVAHQQLGDELTTALPGLRLLGIVTPRQRARPRLSVLGRMAGNTVVIKLGAGDDRLDREQAALELLDADPLPGIATPSPLAAGTIDVDGEPVTYLATTSVALQRQGPAFDAPLRTFESDLASRLGELPKPPGVSDDDVVPVHGDLTPWNLRRTPTGLALFDWEEAGWGRPGSDIDEYRRTSAAVRPWWSRRPQEVVA